MLFREFSEICERVEALSGRLEMIDELAKVLPGLGDADLPVFVRFIMGRVFPDWSPLKLGIGPNLLYEAVAYVVGKKREAVIDRVSAEGDVGKAVELLLAGKTQTSFFTEEMTIGDVYAACEAIALSGGKKSQREKLLAVRKLFANVKPAEGRYLARLILG